MDILQALILSVVEGVTEFLPISSTGHLVLTSHALGITQTNFVKSFEIIIQLGAILSVVVMYWKKLLTQKSVWGKLLVSFLPTAAVGFTLYPLIKNVLLGNPMITLAALFFGGILLIILELLYKEKEHHASELQEITFTQALLVGVFQSVSIIPGVSRAAATIIGGLFSGMKRTLAVEYSFLLAIPTMVAASGLDLLDSKLAFSSQELLILSVGFIGSFIVAYIAIKFFLQYIKSHTFIPFGIYRIVFSVIYFLIFFT